MVLASMFSSVIDLRMVFPSLQIGGGPAFKVTLALLYLFYDLRSVLSKPLTSVSNRFKVDFNSGQFMLEKWY